MKKLLIIISLFAIGFSSCGKDETTTASALQYVKVTIPEQGVSSEETTRVDHDHDTYKTTWVAGDEIAVFLYNGSSTQMCKFTADKTGHTTTFTGDVPVGSYTVAAAYYPYSCGASFDAVNKSYNNTWGTSFCTHNLCDYDFMYSNCHTQQIDVTAQTTSLPLSLIFKPLMSRIKVSLELGANETPRKVTFETSSNVMPTAGTVDELGNFIASQVCNSITVYTDQKEFTIGMLPVNIATTMNVKVTTTDGLTYSDKSVELAGLKRNHHYTMSVDCNKKSVLITVPDAVDSKYGSDTWKNNGFYYVEDQYDPTGIFDDWYFYRAEIKSDKNGDDKLKKNRIQLQVPTGFNDENNGSFVTAPIQCDGQKTVKISFEVATNRGIGNIKYRIGLTNPGVNITESFLRDRNNIQNGNDKECRSGTQTHTFTVSNGQRIMIKIMSTAGSYHVEFANFTYTIE